MKGRRLPSNDPFMPPPTCNQPGPLGGMAPFDRRQRHRFLIVLPPGPRHSGDPAHGQGSSHDLTPVIDLTLDRGTGPFRTRHPIWSDLRPPCNHACPAGENIQAWLALAQAGDYRKAWEILVADNPLPATHGRVCYHPCETNCNRGRDGCAGVDPCRRTFPRRSRRGRGLGLSPPSPRRSGKRVLVVGAGPSGLSAAYHLTRLGHQVEIHEAGPVAGGMLQFGIPAYRLPRAELAAEVARIERFGVRIVLNHPVTDVKAEQITRPLRRGVRRDRRPHRAARRNPGPRRRPHSRCGLDAERRSAAAANPPWGAASSSTAAATRRWTPPAPPAASAPRKP